MSVSDPLLKQLKGHILEFFPVGSGCSVKDNDETIQSLCCVLESILRKGYIGYTFSPFGLTKRDYWSWIDQTRHLNTMKGKVAKILDTVSNNDRITTTQGRGRLFIRYALHHKCLHIPIEHMIRSDQNEEWYSDDSVLGNEILREIFLSLLYQLMHINFDLQLDNAAFLDDTWVLPDYKKLELVPCIDLGIFLGHVNGRAVVLRVEEGSVAAEDNKIEVGDVIDEVYGQCIRGWRKGRINTLLKQNKGLPVPLCIVKGHYKDGKLFSGLMPLLKKLQVDVDCLEEQYSKTRVSETTESSLSNKLTGGQPVDYVGCISVGRCGDVSRIEDAITVIMNQNRPPIPVTLHTGEIGVQTVVINSRKLLLNHSYTEISSCGRRNDQPLYFAYISGDTTCSISSDFTCYIFKALTEDQSRDILLTLADGFHRTHWAV